MARKGLAIGINYVGTDFELRGCINDANQWDRFLNKNGFSVAVLHETSATRQAILDNLGRLVSSLKAGDIGFVTYSGHGTWVPDTSGDEPDGRDEAICPIDMGDDGSNLILDDELAEVYRDLPSGAVLVTVLDSCHSGTAFRFVSVGKPKRRVRFLPPAHFAKSQTMQLKVERAYSTAPRVRTNSPLPGVIHYSGCRDTEYSNDAEIGGRACGAFTNFAVPAFEAAVKAGGTYRDVFNEIRRHLPSWEFQQTPQFAATTKLKSTRVFG